MTPRDTTRQRLERAEDVECREGKPTKPNNRNVVQRVTPRDTTRQRLERAEDVECREGEAYKTDDRNVAQKANRPEREAEA